MKTIWKFPLRLADEQSVMMPKGSDVLSAQLQHGEITIWAEVDASIEAVPHAISIRGTGHPLLGHEGMFVDTIQQGEFVWHVFSGGDLR